jgi:hypothetical protein
MLRVPRSPCEDSNRQNECYNDNGECSKSDRAFPILTIPHAALHVSYMTGERRCPRDGSCFHAGGVPRRSALTIRNRLPAYRSMPSWPVLAELGHSQVQNRPLKRATATKLK